MRKLTRALVIVELTCTETMNELIPTPPPMNELIMALTLHFQVTVQVSIAYPLFRQNKPLVLQYDDRLNHTHIGVFF